MMRYVSFSHKVKRLPLEAIAYSSFQAILFEETPPVFKFIININYIQYIQ